MALSLTVNRPVLVPLTVGVNVTLIMQVPLAAKVVVQVVAETAKSPVVETTMPVNATDWLLVRVNAVALPPVLRKRHWPGSASQPQPPSL